MIRGSLAWAFLLLATTSLVAEEPFGYISYCTTNIGDDIQAIAAYRLLPKRAIPIDREFIGVFDYPETVNTLVNGWFMHTKELWWWRDDIAAPEKSWPPAPSIRPFFISIYFVPEFYGEAFSDEGIAYLKANAPIGARDFSTLEALQKRGIPSYFSGCLTLTLENPYSEREEVIYAVDLDEECLQYLKRKSRTKVIAMPHGVPAEIYYRNDQVERINYAEALLERYCKAKCVVTMRLHAALPCLALGTPVLLISSKDEGRLDGLKELVFHCTKEEFLKNRVRYNFRRPPKNPETYLPIRENLIQRVAEWVRSIED